MRPIKQVCGNVMHNNMPELSVVVPCYNHAAYINKCIDSIFSAYSGKINIIFCDDASSDNSFEIACSILDSGREKNPERISYIALRNERNLGICSTLNNAIEKINTDYIYLIASDDYLMPATLDNAIRQLIDRNLDVLINDCVVVNGYDSVRYQSAFFDFRKGYKKAYQLGKIRDELVMNWIVPGPATLMRSSVYSVVGKYNADLMAEDRDFYLRVLSMCNVGFSEAVIACYRVHDRNVSRSSTYRNKIRAEMANVNIKYAKNYSGLSRIYLTTYLLDKYNIFCNVGKMARFLLYTLFRITLVIRSGKDFT